MKSSRSAGGVRAAANLRRWISRQLVEQRAEAGVTQSQLAHCARIDQGHLSRIEAGLASPSLEVLAALANCLGSELNLRLFPTAGPRLHDRFQAPMVEALVRHLGREWRSRPEVPVVAARGVIDLVLDRALDRLTLVCECHSELRRLEEVIRRASEKTEAFRATVQGPSTVSTLLLLRSTRDTREVARAFEATLRSAYPARTLDALVALQGRSAWPGPAVVWARVEKGRAEILEGPPRGVRLGR